MRSIPVDVLFEAKSLQEVQWRKMGSDVWRGVKGTVKTAVPTAAGMAVGGGIGAGVGAVGAHSAAKSQANRQLQQFIQQNQLNPNDPADAQKIAAKKSELFKGLGRSTLRGAAAAGTAGALAGGALGASRSVGGGLAKGAKAVANRYRG